MQSATITELAEALATGQTTAEHIVKSCFESIDEPSGQGARVYLEVDRAKALALAQSSDTLREHGVVPSPLAGIPISVKDLFDVAGELTRAGSLVLDDTPAPRDAPVIARLRAAGAVFVGRTNMTEFAYSGVGMNPHHGTPANPFERHVGRIPGGSSSGAAVSITDGMAAIALGTDTGGSSRIPAALCGIVGFKSTATRIPLDGCVPLSPSYDSVGCLGRSVACVAFADSVMADSAGDAVAPAAFPLENLRFAVPETLVLDEADDTVATAFSRALSQLSALGASIHRIPMRELGEIPALAHNGGIVAAEAYAWHAQRIDSHGDDYDPRVRARILMGRQIDAREYLALLEERRRLIAACAEATRDYDAVVMPTTPIVAPTFSAFESDDEFVRLNKLLLRNPSIANALDRCAISLPCHASGEPPVGLTLMGQHGGDRSLLRVAAAVEDALGRHRDGASYDRPAG